MQDEELLRMLVEAAVDLTVHACYTVGLLPGSGGMESSCSITGMSIFLFNLARTSIFGNLNMIY